MKSSKNRFGIAPCMAALWAEHRRSRPHAPWNPAVEPDEYEMDPYSEPGTNAPRACPSAPGC